LDIPVTLHIALVERTANGNILRKLLPQSSGRTITHTWNYGESELVNVQYAMDVPVTDPDALYILAFEQERDQANDTRDILQTAIIKSNRKKGITVVGIEDDPVTGELREISLYPNPSSQVLKVTADIALSRPYSWHLVDQRGVVVLTGELYQDFSHGPQEIDVSKLANGIYFMAIQTGDNSIVHKKIAVMNRN
jgi:hypothetical protein